MGRLLLIVLLLAGPAHAGEPALDPESAPAPSPTPLPAESPTDLRLSCPDLRACCVPGEDACWHPKLARGLLLGSGAAFAGVGAAGWLIGGDTLGSGDPYGALIGVGAVGGLGAALGALFGALSPAGETAVEDRPGRALFRARLSPGGGAILGESSPLGFSFAFDPTIRFGDVLRLQPHVGFATGLGVVEHVDPRPQHSGAFPSADRQERLRVSAGAELTLRLPYPTPKVRKPIGAGRIEIRYRPTLEVRRRVHHAGGSNEQIQEHIALHPLLLGFRWHTSPRQRFTMLLGPRLDWYGLSAPGAGEVEVGGALTGTFYAEAWYQVDVPMTPHGRTATSVNGRFNVGYVHSMLDGVTLDVGAIIGFLGPVNVSYDLRIRRRGAPVAVQLTGGIWIGEGGGPYLEVGFVAPAIDVPGKGAS